MFGITISKLLLIVLVVVAVWKGARILLQLQKRMEEINKNVAARQNSEAKAPKQPTTDLVACQRCGTYVPNGTWCPSVEQCKYRKS